MTINLEQAKRLAELGVDKPAGKDWRIDYDGNTTIVRDYGCTRKPLMDVKFIPAYNAEELISMIDGSYRIAVCGDKSARIASDYYTETFEADTLTEALCNKLIYDLENGIVTA